MLIDTPIIYNKISEMSRNIPQIYSGFIEKAVRAGPERVKTDRFRRRGRLCCAKRRAAGRFA